MILFVCAANVGRSQIAEGIAKYFGLSAISCAAVEARKEKYNGKPDKEITKLLLKKYNINIFNQKILYPEDIKKEILSVYDIIFLFNPKEVEQIDEEVLIDNMPLWAFLELVGKEYKIFSVKDPANQSISDKEQIIDQIYHFIKIHYVK